MTSCLIQISFGRDQTLRLWKIPTTVQYEIGKTATEDDRSNSSGDEAIEEATEALEDPPVGQPDTVHSNDSSTMLTSIEVKMGTQAELDIVFKILMLFSGHEFGFGS